MECKIVAVCRRHRCYYHCGCSHYLCLLLLTWLGIKRACVCTPFFSLTYSLHLMKMYGMSVRATSERAVFSAFHFLYLKSLCWHANHHLPQTILLNHNYSLIDTLWNLLLNMNYLIFSSFARAFFRLDLEFELSLFWANYEKR